jgi:hypothetical protein
MRSANQPAWIGWSGIRFYLAGPLIAGEAMPSANGSRKSRSDLSLKLDECCADLERSLGMPLVRIDLLKGKDATYRQNVGRVVHEAMIGVGVPEKDGFQIITEHDENNFIFDSTYLGIERTATSSSSKSPGMTTECGGPDRLDRFREE